MIRPRNIIGPFHAWAARDLLRRPEETLLLGTVMCLVVVLSGTALLLTHSLSSTAERMIASAPSLVVRKTGGGGWQPIPAAPAVRSAEAVPGVVRALPRVWGVVSSPEGPVTVIGADTEMDGALALAGVEKLPDAGEAIVGQALSAYAQGDTFRLEGAASVDVQVVGKFGPESGIAAHDIVLLHMDAARRLLGLSEAYASDLAVYVFNDQEEKAILPDLFSAFPWPVRIAMRTETAAYYSASFSKRGGLVYVAFIPSALAMALLFIYTGSEKSGRKSETGLLKSIGWTTGNIVKLHLLRAFFVSFPAAVIGMSVAYALVLRSGAGWPWRIFFGWDKLPPTLYLDTGGAFMVLAEVASLVILPFLATSVWTALKYAAADPIDLLEEEGM